MCDQEERLIKIACEQFLRRKKYASQLKRIDNSGLHAGSPMYYYCNHCGVPLEVLPEDHLFPRRNECSQCYALNQKKWMKFVGSFEK